MSRELDQTWFREVAEAAAIRLASTSEGAQTQWYKEHMASKRGDTTWFEDLLTNGKSTPPEVIQFAQELIQRRAKAQHV